MYSQLLRFVVVQVCLHAVLTGLRMAVPLWALRTFGGTVAAGALVAMFGVSQVLLGLPAGRLVDRHGLRLPLAWGLGLAAAGAALAALLPSPPWLAIVLVATAALLAGAGSGLAVIALQRHLGRLAQTPAERRSVFSWLALGPSLSNIVGPMLAGVLIDVAGFRTAFLALAALPGLAWLLLRTTPMPPGVDPGTASPPPALGALLHVPGLVRLIYVNWLLAMCWDVHSFLVPILGHERGLSAAAIGTVLAVFAVATAAVRLLMPLLAGTLREGEVLGRALLGTAAIFAFYPLVGGFWAMAGCAALLGLVLGSVQPMIMSALHQLVPPAQVGAALGLRLVAIHASGVAMPLMFGVVGAALGPATLFWLAGAASLLSFRVAQRLALPSDGSAPSTPQTR